MMPYTPFFVDVDCGPTRPFPPIKWSVRGVRNLPYDGRPNAKNLLVWVARFEAQHRATVWRAELRRETLGVFFVYARYSRPKSQVKPTTEPLSV